jgi:hypothetical protein
MATLIAVYNSEGLVGRCDAKCYKAASPECECVCGGRNHGAGFQKALENTRELFETILEEFINKHKLESWRAEINALEPIQLSLFGEE